MDDTLYREELMEVYKNTSNRGRLTDPSIEIMQKNPMCGDEIVLQLKLSDTNPRVIEDAKFDGVACAVSVISSSYLLDALKGKSIEEAKNMTKEQLLEMLNLNLTTSRVKCATLVLDALKNAIDQYEQR